jgi:hypothetical protein
MPDPGERWRQFGLDEAYEVVRTLVVVMNTRTYRIEVLKSYSRPGYSTRCWTEAEAILRPRVAEPLLERVLVEYDLPMAIGDDPDVVLTEALGFLRDGLRAE